MFAEMVCYLDSVGESVYGVLQGLYEKYGYFVEKALSVTFGGLDGMEKMKKIMLSLRERTYSDIAGTKVLAVSDFVSRVKTDADGRKENIALPKTNALKLHLENGDWICVRPSGTEPKLKFYVATSKNTKQEATELADRYLAYMKSLAE